MADIEQTVDVDAPADLVYAMVSDLPRMGEWSPECTRVTWRDSAAGPAAGARFVGYNKAGGVRWATMGVVTAAEPGRRFRFDIYVGPISSSSWEYLIGARPDGGCTLTERWVDQRPWLVRHGMDRAFGSRARRNTRGIATTLANLKHAAEAERSPS